MKVIIGVDDSPHSKAALETVSRMRWPNGTQFTVLSAAPLAVVAYAMADAGVGAYVQDVQDLRVREHEELAARAEATLRSAGLSTKAQVELGDPREALVRVATAEGADLIIVGSHGRKGIPKMLMGSVASHVVTHAPCSVMVVKVPERGAAG